jgi:hypothetical protein
MLSYCDYISQRIRNELLGSDKENLIRAVGRINYDLDEAGAMRSTKKIITVQDRNGKEYKITVEEA